MVQRLRRSKYIDVLHAYEQVTLLHQRARLRAPNTLTLADGSEVTAGKIVIATGGSPCSAPIRSLADSGFLDSTTAMELDQLPWSLIVLGGSSVGLELGQMFARLGVEVTVVEVAPTLLPSEDPVVGDALTRYLSDEGLQIHVGAQVERVDRGDGVAVRYHVEAREHTLRAERLLVATGRRANTRDFGLEAAGVERPAQLRSTRAAACHPHRHETHAGSCNLSPTPPRGD